MKKIEKINPENIGQIQALAYRIWPIAYRDLLTEEQIHYMLKMMYDSDVIQNDMDRGVLYYILTLKDLEVGFIAIEPNAPQEGMMRLNKLYLDTNYHNQGLGKHMLDTIELIAKGLELHTIELNVNRYNSAVHVYKKQGYEISYSEDVPIGEGFLMEDYVMSKTLR